MLLLEGEEGAEALPGRVLGNEGQGAVEGGWLLPEAKRNGGEAPREPVLSGVDLEE